MSAKDDPGREHPFGIAWTGTDDVAGGIVVRAAGFDAYQVAPLMDTTDLYELMHRTLFGSALD